MRLRRVELHMQRKRGITAFSAAARPAPYRWIQWYEIPLSSPAASRFYFEHLVLPLSLSEILWTTLARNWPKFGRAIMLAYGQKNGHMRWPLLKEGITNASAPEKQFLDQEIQQYVCSTELEPVGSLSLLKLSNNENLRRRQTVAFLFDASSSAPRAVAKFSADPRQQAVLKHEYESLEYLTRIFGCEKSEYLPRPLAFFEASPWTVLLESCLPGCTAYFEMRNSWNPLRHIPKHFRLALEWLIVFQRTGGIQEIRMNHSVMRDYIVQPLQKFAEQTNLSLTESQVIEKTTKLALHLLGEKMILAAHHGDFWTGNLVIHNNFAGVIDWEHFEAKALPFDDLFLFTTTYGLNFPWKLAHWAAPETAFRGTYLQATEIAHCVRDFLLNYCRSMELSTSLLEVFFPVFLAKKAMKETARKYEDVDVGNAIAQKQPSRLRVIKPGTRSCHPEVWRHFFRIYAERNEPVCFGNRPERKEEAG